MPKKNRNSYLDRKYGITEADYERMLAAQDGVCWISGVSPDQIRLHIDHDHSIPKIKLETKKIAANKWAANTVYQPDRPKLYFEAYGTTKGEAVQKVRKMLLKCSVRGLLSWRANRLLGQARDNPNILAAAADYLREFEKKFH